MENFIKKTDYLFRSKVFETNKYSKHNFNSILLSKTGRQDMLIYPPDSKTHKLNLEHKAVSKIFNVASTMFEANKRNGNIYETIYSFPTKLTENVDDIDFDFMSTNQEMLVINKSKEISRGFISFICNKAIQLKKDDGLDSISNSKFFITGEVGVGKTAFLNYLFSLYHSELRKKNVIWIRVDLTKHYHGNATLEDSLDFQIARIYRQHYMKSKVSKSNTRFENFIRPFFQNEKDNLNQEIELNKALKDYYMPFDDKRTIPYNKNLQKSVKAYIEKYYGVIYIYDGLDKVRTTNDFDEKLDEVKNIINSEKFKSVYIFVMRYESQQDLLYKVFKYKELNQLSQLRGYGMSFRIVPSELSDIIDKRIDLIKQHWKVFLKKNADEIFNKDIGDKLTRSEIYQLCENIKWLDSEALDNYILVFKHYLSRALTFDEDNTTTIEDNSNNAFGLIEKIAGKNIRLDLQIIRECFTCFLESLEICDVSNESINEIGINLASYTEQLTNNTNYKQDLGKILSKHYRIVATLLRKKSSYVHPFDYVRIKDNLERKTILKSYETSYINNLFYSINSDGLSDKYCLLLKIRILQLLRIKPIDIENIISEIKRNFPYNSVQIDYAIEELKHCDYISIKPNEFDNKNFYCYVITESGLNLIDKLIYDYNYIRIILDDIIIPKDYENNFIDSHSELYQKDKIMWSIYQIKRVLNFVNLVYNVESRECKLTNFLTSEEWNLANKMYIGFLEGATKILYKYDKDLKHIQEII